jgi:hypothetical protein
MLERDDVKPQWKAMCSGPAPLIRRLVDMQEGVVRWVSPQCHDRLIREQPARFQAEGPTSLHAPALQQPAKATPLMLAPATPAPRRRSSPPPHAQSAALVPDPQVCVYSQPSPLP